MRTIIGTKDGQEVRINIDDDGRLRFIYHDDLAGLVAAGVATVARVSDVEPSDAGGWSADMARVAGPVLGPFQLRQDALAAEVAWLREHRGL